MNVNKTVRIAIAVVALTNPLTYFLVAVSFCLLVAYVAIGIAVEATRWQMTVKVTRPRRKATHPAPAEPAQPLAVADVPAPTPLPDAPVVVTDEPVVVLPDAGQALAEFARQARKPRTATTRRRRLTHAQAATAEAPVARVKKSAAKKKVAAKKKTTTGKKAAKK